jgi:proteasome lid subunit RPN8/RPN11
MNFNRLLKDTREGLVTQLPPVFIAENIRQAMIDHAAAELPNECCGLLIGRGGCIERSVAMRNTEPAPDSYIMDPEQQIALFTEMERTGEQLLGIYHSHPTSPALPSGPDLQLAFHPEAVYVIVSLEGKIPDVRGFRLTENGFKEVSLRIS